MSCNNWERGSIIVPAKDWAGFRKGLLEAWNAKQEELHAEAKIAFGKLNLATRGKRGLARLDAMRDALHEHCGFHSESWGWDPPGNEARVRFNALERLLLIPDPKVPGSYDRTKLVHPKKSALDLKPVSKDAVIHLPEASVHFRNKDRTVTWNVDKGNHAVENAHEHWFAKKLFAALKNVEWTRGSGGQILGNDEYNRDAGRDYAGGGGSYAVFNFGGR